MSEEKTIVESLIPTSRQAMAFAAPERNILYGGAMGGGKSTWLAAYANELSLRYPGNIGYLCRHELSSFKKTTLLSLQELIHWELVHQWHKTENFIRYKNGSIIYFGGLGDDRRAIDRLKSLEIGWFGIDQAEETTEQFFYMLSSRLRLRTQHGLRYKALLTANPDPGWLKHRFIEQDLPDHAFIPALPKDNPHLPGDYEENLRRMLPEELIAAWLEGHWDTIAAVNQIYKDKDIMAALGRTITPPEEEPEVYGMDVAEYGGDESVIARKKGFKFTIPFAEPNIDPMELVGHYVRLVNYDKTKKVRVDAIGPGNGVYYRLKELGFNVVPIKGSESPATEINKERYRNRKTELYWQFRLILPHIDLPAEDSLLRSQLSSARYRTTSEGIIMVETKAELRRRNLPSPDRLEACVYANADTELEDDEGEVYWAGMSDLPPERKPARATEKQIQEYNDDEGKVFF